MKKYFLHIILIALLAVSYPCIAQTENPRGIYKMTILTGKQGEIKAPFDQYKICTDSVTLMLSVNGDLFLVGKNDSKIFNYTGDQPKDENDKSTLIYDSNADHFTLKWWSTYKSHRYFPDNDWCIEKYEANKFSDAGQRAFDILNYIPSADSKNTLLGTWRIIGYMDELHAVKKELARLHADYPSSKYLNSFVIFTPETYSMIVRGNGYSNYKIEYLGKKAYKLNNKTTSSIKWLSKDCIAIEEKDGYRIDWQILERLTDNQSMLSRIASRYVGR